MTKLTIITGSQVCGSAEVEVKENGEHTVYSLPVGVELTVSDAVAQAAVQQCDCLVGYFVADETAVAGLPVTGIADGSYCFIMSTGVVKFLCGGMWR